MTAPIDRTDDIPFDVPPGSSDERPPVDLETIGERAAHREAVASYREQLVLDQKSVWPAAAIIAILSALFDAPWGFVLAGVIAVMGAVRLNAFRPLGRGDLVGAVRWVAVGTWGVGIGVVAIIPDAFPIMVINLVSPLIVAAINLTADEVRKMTVAAVGVAIVMGALGFRSEGTDLDEAAPVWVFQVVIIGYLVAHVVLMGSLVAETNRVRLAWLDRARGAAGQLARTHDELRRSRARVVSAGDRERERIERNIHDGAQQRLVALGVRLRLAGQLARQGRPTDADELDALHAEAQDAIDELRELARGIYPSILAERGLADALRSLGRSAAQRVTVDAPDDLHVPDPADAAALYFVCAEALQNAAKHAPDASVALVVDQRADALTITITDDGPGFDPGAVENSRGMLNMSDRAAAMGGTFEVTSEAGRGCRVEVAVRRLGRDSLAR